MQEQHTGGLVSNLYFVCVFKKIMSLLQAYSCMCPIQGNVCEIAVLSDMPCQFFLLRIVTFVQHLSFLLAPHS